MKPSPWLLALILLLSRAPSFLFGVVDVDETDYFVIGRMMRAGGLPYVDIVEKKPILSYFFYYFASAFGWSMLPARILALGVSLLTFTLIYQAGRRWTGDRGVGLAAAWIAVLVSAANVWSINAALTLNLFQALALLLFVRFAQQKTASSALSMGLAVGLSSLCKHQAAIVLVAFALAILLVRPRWRWLPCWLGLGAGFTIPWLVAAAVYLRLGHLPEFLEWNVYRNLLYSAHAPGSALWRGVEGFGLCVVLGAPLWWWLAGRELLQRWRAGTVDPESHVAFAYGLVLVLTLLPVSMGGRFYEHYFLQFVPSLSLLAAPGLAALWARRARLPAPQRRLAWVLALGPALGFWVALTARGVLGGYPNQEPHARAAAEWLRAHAAPADRLFVWGHFTPIYFLAQRLPGTRYANTSVHMGDFDPGHLPFGFDVRPFTSARDVDLTLADLTRNRPRWLVDTAPADIHGWRQVPLSGFPSLERFVQTHYRHVADPGGAAVYQWQD